MAIIQTVDSYLFCEAFKQVRPDNFSYEGLELLFEYLDDLSDDMGENIELDVIALCCDYAEYSLEDWFNEYGDFYSLYDNLSIDDVYNVEVMIQQAGDADNIIAHNNDYSVIIVNSNA